MHTEDEAKTKWCPMFRHDEGDNRPWVDSKGVGRGYCLGSACMAWRWGPSPMVQDRRGYCGLAGRPGI